MEELMRIETTPHGVVVSAKDLHNFLEVKSNFPTWCKRMFEYGFEENKDYSIINSKKGININVGRPELDFALHLDCAKEIAMLQRSEKGKQARQYFIACEKKLKDIQAPICLEDAIIQQLQVTKAIRLEQEALKAKQNEHENRLTLIEAKTATRPDYFTVMGYAILKHLKVGIKDAARIGQKAARICKDKGYSIDRIHDARFGQVGSYPQSVLEDVFAPMF